MVGQRVEAEKIDQLPAELYERAAAVRIGAGELTLALSESEYDRTLIQLDRDLGRAVLLSDAPEMKSAFEARKARLRGTKLTPYDGALSPDALEALTKIFDVNSRGLSVSRIHNYADCPQQLLPRQRARSQADRGARGDDLHLRNGSRLADPQDPRAVPARGPQEGRGEALRQERGEEAPQDRG